MDIEGIRKLNEWVRESDNIVFFGGAGVSTESGIPDFRSVDGLYHRKWKYPPEQILSHSFFERNPEEYYRFHREKLVIEGVKPNRAHLKLAELEEAGKLRAVITQNIDGLHQEAGSKKVLELHGSILRAYCSRCRKPYPQEVINHGEGVPRCDCGGVIRPDIVLYEEPLDQDIMEDAVRYIRNARRPTTRMPIWSYMRKSARFFHRSRCKQKTKPGREVRPCRGTVRKSTRFFRFMKTK